MLLGDPDYFVADIDCQFSLHPYMNGKKMPPQLSQKTIDNAMETNPFRARREYYNLFDNDSSDDVFVKRLIINKYSQPYFPIFENEDGKKKYIIAYDPATKLDNSIILVAELVRNEERGLMIKLVNCINLIEILSNGEKAIIQKPEQVERLKNIILDYNKGALDYENIQRLIIDSGAGGGGTDIGQYLLNEWKGQDGKIHIGFIDTNDPYMALREEDYMGNSKKLRMFNFKKEKTIAYERAQQAINQGLVIFPTDLNARNEIELTEQSASGDIMIRYEKADYDEINSLVQMSLLKEEITGMQKVKKLSGNVVFEQSVEAKQQGKHDDRVDTLVMICNELMELRAAEALAAVEKPQTEYKEMLKKMNIKMNNNNPFGHMGGNPFANRQRPGMYTPSGF